MPDNITPPSADDIPNDPSATNLAEELRDVLGEGQQGFSFASLCLNTEQTNELADLVADFAIDLHKNFGIWQAYEQYNREFFDTPLPMTPCSDSGGGAGPIHRDRVQHLLWVLYPEVKGGLILSPTHEDLERLAEVVTEFVSDQIVSLPKDSPIKDYLEAPNDFGWDIKGKLMWLGAESYMFRPFYQTYMRRHAEESGKIDATDDFLCQECTRWSGLGPIDILARMLDLPESDRRDLRSWYERHFALYKVIRGGEETIEVLNLINDRRYTVRVSAENNRFESGTYVGGSLVPWRDEWYWSGLQRGYNQVPDEAIAETRRKMRSQNPQIVCRYDEEYEQTVREHMEATYQEMMDYHGTDLIYYPDGLSMASDWKEQVRHQHRSHADSSNGNAERQTDPDISIPDELVEAENGVAVFLNPEEGQEMMREFDPLVSGLKRNPDNLAQEERDAIIGFIRSDAISPRFVRRVAEEYGFESILSAWQLPRGRGTRALEYLLRSHKGRYFRKRYPAIGIVQEPQ